MLLILFSLIVICFAKQDPSCPSSGYVIQDPATGKTYTYDLKKLQEPDSSTNLFLTGTEPAQSWQANLNICGDASAIGCTESTPMCQNDGTGHYESMGSSSSWTVSAFYDPKKGPSSPLIFDGGVVVTISDGSLCQFNSVARNTHLFLKCDPTVTTPLSGSPFAIAEADPSNPTVATPCSYFATISHALFCPQVPTVPKGPFSMFNTSLDFVAPLRDVTIVGSSLDALLNLGLSCAHTCADGIVKCTGSITHPASLPNVNVSYVQGSGPEFSFTLDSAGPGVACPNSTTLWYLSATKSGVWGESRDGVSFYAGKNAVFSATNPTSSQCITCSQNATLKKARIV